MSLTVLVACGSGEKEKVVYKSGPEKTVLAPSAEESKHEESAVQKDPIFPMDLTPISQFYSYSYEFTQNLEDAVADFTKTQGLKPQLCFTEPRDLRITFAIGYEDFAPDLFVSDLLERDLFEKFLQKPCNSSFPLCGFRLITSNSFKSVLQKENGEKKIQITITTSSISTNNEYNQNQEAQLLKSDYAYSQFLNSFRSQDVIVYWGHGRDGGGPDFYPPRLLKDGHVDYPLYRRQLPGRSLLQAALGLRGRRTQYVGLFACNTIRLTRDFHKVFPDVNLVGTKTEIFSDEMTRASLAFVSGLVLNNCDRTIVENRKKATESLLSLEGPVYTAKNPARAPRKKKGGSGTR